MVSAEAGETEKGETKKAAAINAPAEAGTSNLAIIRHPRVWGQFTACTALKAMRPSRWALPHPPPAADARRAAWTPRWYRRRTWRRDRAADRRTRPPGSVLPKR